MDAGGGYCDGKHIDGGDELKYTDSFGANFIGNIDAERYAYHADQQGGTRQNDGIEQKFLCFSHAATSLLINVKGL